MAIYSAVPPPPELAAPTTSGHQHSLSNASTATVDVEAWTVSALQSLSINPLAVGTGNPLTIPLDEHRAEAAKAAQLKLRNVRIAIDPVGASITPPRRPPSRRDSMRRREALLKGNEGSRQRRRWENGTSSSITPSAHRYHRFTLDRLLHLPNVEPPQPVDWDVRPTHPVHNVPYQLAHYWDKKGGVRELVEERKTKTTGLPSTGKVPRELHAKAKRTPAVKSWLRVLEEPVRQFLVDRGVAGREESDSSSLDSEDEEIVFVGRNGSMHDARSWKKARREKKDAEPQQGMVLDSLGDDESAAFKRWLTHSISDYYGLDSRSVSMGTPAKKVVYVGIKQMPSRNGLSARRELPRPLWEMF